jgi:hypothetical protein
MADDRALPLPEPLVLRRDRHLKWKAFDGLEMILMICCGAERQRLHLPLRYQTASAYFGRLGLGESGLAESSTSSGMSVE